MLRLVFFRLMGTCTLLALMLQPRQASSQNVNQVSSSAGIEKLVPPRFIGSYRPSGKFKGGSKLSCMAPQRPAEVPAWIDLCDHSEAVRENFAPPARATGVLHPKSRSAGLLESVLTLAYGREGLLHAPTHLAVDSRQRVIVTDPAIAAVHVLDGKLSFRIAGGIGRRLRQPNGVAVDDRDNIYVADGKIGLILVYDAAGTYLRAIGSFKGEGESIFQEPVGIAIDRGNRRLYVLDSPSNELFVLSLDGNVLQRVGGRRHKEGVNFDFPSEIAVRDSTIVVLDSHGSRLQTFDLRFNLRNAFNIHATPEEAKLPAMGLALDDSGNIYVNNGIPGIRIYRQNGTLVGALSSCDKSTPGIWIDSTNRIYLADPSFSRIILFQRLPVAAERNTARNRPAHSASLAE